MLRTLLITSALLFAPPADAVGGNVCQGTPASCKYNQGGYDNSYIPSGVCCDRNPDWVSRDYSDCARVNQYGDLTTSSECDAKMTYTQDDPADAGSCIYTAYTIDVCAAVEDLEDSTACDAVGVCTFSTCTDAAAARRESRGLDMWDMCDDDAMGYAIDDGYDVVGCSNDDRRAVANGDDPSDKCLACLTASTEVLAAMDLRVCGPEADDAPCADDLESPECRVCVSEQVLANIKEGSPVCEYAGGPDVSGDEYYLGNVNGIEECVATIMAMFPDAADRESMAMTYSYDCDLEEDKDEFGECYDSCYVELGVDRADWEDYAADYASYSIEDIEGNEWHSCYFNVTYDEAAAIEEAEAACGYAPPEPEPEPEPAPDKTSGGLVATASIGMVANALISALW